jgi:hypothetical protein
MKDNDNVVRLKMLPTEKKSHFEEKYNIPTSVRKREKLILDVKVKVEVA